MELILIFSLVWVLVFGYWLMCGLDRFIDSGGIQPYWDEAEMLAAREKSGENKANKHL